jgi:hypothetical protein
VHSKDDPLEQARPRGKVTLWLNREHMLEARENYWRAFRDSAALDDIPDGAQDYRTWNIAYAAAVAAFDFLQAGKITPS